MITLGEVALYTEGVVCATALIFNRTSRITLHAVVRTSKEGGEPRDSVKVGDFSVVYLANNIQRSIGHIVVRCLGFILDAR